MRLGRFRSLNVGIDGIEAVEAATDWQFPRHWHEHYGIGVIEQGAQRSASGRGPVEAGAGDVITVNPGEVHDGTPIGDAGRSWRMLYLCPRLVAEIVADVWRDGAGDYEFAAPVERHAGLAALTRRVFAAATASVPGARLAADIGLVDLLASISHGRRPVAVGQAATVAIKRARAFIDAAPESDIRLDDLAEVSGLSRFQVVRGFSGSIGMTPHAYQIQRRLQLARSLIANGTGLAEAALASGFHDQSHLTRHFTRTFGLTPGRFARALKAA